MLEPKCYGLRKWFTVSWLYPATYTFLNTQMLDSILCILIETETFLNTKYRTKIFCCFFTSMSAQTGTLR